jgi:hypothetical protein
LGQAEGETIEPVKAEIKDVSYLFVLVVPGRNRTVDIFFSKSKRYKNFSGMVTEKGVSH